MDNNNAKHVLLIMIIAMTILTMKAHAAPASTSLIPQQSFCGGAPLSFGGSAIGGAIPETNILGNASLSDQRSVLDISLLIMLLMMLIASVFYMMSSVLKLNMLKEFAKDEIWEVAVTVMIVLIFLVGFSITAAGVTKTPFNAKGVGPTRQVYIDDCSYLLDNSVNLLPSLFALKVETYLFDTVESATFNYKPSYFGLSISPFDGYNLLDKLLNLLGSITTPLIFMQLGVIVFLGLIFGLFPLFLYAGIILRTIPWTRAAGGAFIGLFIGFYIVFPLLLHVTISGYTISNQQLLSSNPIEFGSVSQLASGISGGGYSSASGFFGYLGGYLKGIFTVGGLVPSYITEVIEPGFFSIITIIISFMISYDIVEISGKLLGAPSLSAGSMLGKLIK